MVYHSIYLRGSVLSRLLSIGAKTGAYVLCHVSLVEGFVSKNEIDNTFNVLNRTHLFLNFLLKLLLTVSKRPKRTTWEISNEHLKIIAVRFRQIDM